jgi:RNA polymerase sigma factor
VSQREPFDGGLVLRAQAGDGGAREALLNALTPLVLRVASRVAGRYLEVGRDEEVSVGLLALQEAIDRFEPERGVQFAAFAEVVIRRRVVDYYRSQRRAEREHPLSQYELEDAEGEVENPVLRRAGVEAWRAAEEEAARREEIEAYRQVLASFGIDFAELPRLSPRHQDARRAAQAVARRLVSDERLRTLFLSTRRLPIQELLPLVGVSRKTLERQRRYIVAVAAALLSPLPYLQEYLKGGDGS